MKTAAKNLAAKLVEKLGAGWTVDVADDGRNLDVLKNGVRGRVCVDFRTRKAEHYKPMDEGYTVLKLGAVQDVDGLIAKIRQALES